MTTSEAINFQCIKTHRVLKALQDHERKFWLKTFKEKTNTIEYARDLVFFSRTVMAYIYN